MAVYSECKKLDPEFMPTANTLFKMGEWQNEKGKGKTAVKCFNMLIKAYPQSPLVPKSYFRAAQVFNDRLMDPEKARKILKGLMQKYPEHEMIPKIKNYLENL